MKKSYFSLFSPQLFANVHKPEIIIVLLYAIPGIPVIILPYLLAKIPVPTYKFWFFSTIGSLPPIILYTVIGSSLASESYLLLTLTIGLLLLGLGVTAYHKNEIVRRLYMLILPPPPQN